MKKAFTLIELMVVVAVITALLTITFKIVGIGDDTSRRNVTIQRMQRLENALSGYYAAFGSYPPVETYYKRNVYAKLDSEGQQTQSGEEGTLNWESVSLACQAQPVAARFPFSSKKDVQDYVDNLSRIIVNRINSDDEQYKAYKEEFIVKRLGGGFTPLNSPNQVNGWDRESRWEKVKVFQFGVMSFLMPRYLFMTVGLDDDDLEDCKQWNDNNRLSAHPNTGESFGSWRDQMKDARLVKRIPSQAVCARWMPNFEKTLSMNMFSIQPRFFGVNVYAGPALKVPRPGESPTAIARDVYPDQKFTILDKITVEDGWDQEFYYYSPPPFQSYRLWSAGPNGRTFPPWVPLDTLKSDADRKTATEWMKDDIAYMSN